jgi:ABC-type sugar transport system ATPase subunit
MSSEGALVEGRGLTKRFGAVEAVRGVDFRIGRREIVGFAGDNGAGKSTLMKIVAGALQPTDGSLTLDGTPVTHYSPTHARSLGIEMVYQDLALCENLDVRENIFLGREPRRSLLGLKVVAHEQMTQAAEELLGRLEIDVASLADPVSVLSGGQRQAVAICRALAFSPHLVIMDEPSAALSGNAVKPLLELIRRLPAQGTSVLLVSHRLSDLLSTSDRIYVLRSGRLAAELLTGETSEAEVLHLMAGLGTNGR